MVSGTHITQTTVRPRAPHNTEGTRNRACSRDQPQKAAHTAAPRRFPPHPLLRRPAALPAVSGSSPELQQPLPAVLGTEPARQRRRGRGPRRSSPRPRPARQTHHRGGHGQATRGADGRLRMCSAIGSAASGARVTRENCSGRRAVPAAGYGACTGDSGALCRPGGTSGTTAQPGAQQHCMVLLW